ncbi:uncharacterized protein LOC124921067 [Impatiens glandulifera]|uniref:uncharacterized protein LOC124921067 n=1 Tax=Impatiens glandulifera TaxID=253017 RepID=UPI001FB0B680|nr:uncharacterized protein LOC124921067 [Impatiens glandulifera]
MEDGFGSYYFENRDLQEEEIWSVNVREELRSDHDSSPKQQIRKSNNNFSSSRVIPIRTNSSSTKKGIHHHHHQSSAPIEIPDWSRIYRKTAKKASWMDHEQDDDHFVYHDQAADQNVDGDDDDDEEEEMIPPHEFIARKLSRTQISSFSMCEGAGRTLKGRDLSKVRNAVLTKTGFLE